MDIKRPFQNNILYKKGDKHYKGVVDLRVLVSQKSSKTNRRSSQQLRQFVARHQPINDIKHHNSHRGNNYNEQKQIARITQQTIDTCFNDIVTTYQQNQNHQKKSTKKRQHLIDLSQKTLNLRFALLALLIPFAIHTLNFYQTQTEEKGRVLGASTAAYQNLQLATDHATSQNFYSTINYLREAKTNFTEIQDTLQNLGLGAGKLIINTPFNTPLSTAQNLAQAGEELTNAGEQLSLIINKFTTQSQTDNFLITLADIDHELTKATEHLNQANHYLQKTDTKYLPQDVAQKIQKAQNYLPLVATNLQKLNEDYPAIKALLGNKKPQKYLLIFQNNSEIRATGGFIGSYGIVDIQNGKITNLMIDDIFNPDGQLQEKIVPPMPVQKISAAWSMHDANWFADFPTSAQKVASFYEKTGGPTVDGVISLTPEVVIKLLKITGPIELPQYNLTITADNFLQQTQQQVEVLYDQKKNQPKQILKDLTPLLIEKITYPNSTTDNYYLDLLKVLETSLEEKHILIYHRHPTIEQMLQRRGWAGDVKQYMGDYLSVINSNINGYKTDAVIKEKIFLQTDITSDGSVTNTLTITRTHQGGDSAYDWYNRVNANYMRVYVPQGSILLQATGHTVEEYNPPINYNSFKIDEEVKALESTIKIDPESQTQIFQEANKTVFGNWVYVSPQETVTITYKYLLPFKINNSSLIQFYEHYRIFIQKQSGSVGSDFSAKINTPSEWSTIWHTPNLTSNYLNTTLKTDTYYGLIFNTSTTNNNP